MKKKRLILRIFACILVCSLSLTVFQPLSVFSEQSTQVAESKPEKWVPSEEDMRLPNTKGDLTLEQLETAQLSAEDIPEYISQESIEEKGHVNRLREQENDDNTVIFQNRDGTKTVYFFSNPVKYTDENGNKKDKKTKLDSKNIPEKYSDKYGYVNQDNDIKTYFPKQITSNQGMLLESKDISIELIPIDAVEKKYVLQNGSILTPGEYLSENKTASVKSISNISVNSNIAKINTEKLSVQKASANKASVTDEKTNYPKDTVQYNGVFGNKTNLRYSATFEGFKEDIILYENTGVNSFRFKLKTNGLSLVCGEDEQYYLSNPLNGERLAAIGELIVYDSNNKKYKNDQGKEYNHHYEVTTVKADDEYILTVVVDEEFLNSSDTTYPVYIDPAVTIMPQSSVKNAAIYSNGIVFANDNSEVKIGYTSSYGTGRGLYDFPILNFNQDFMFLYGNQISSATLNLYAQPYSYNNTSPNDSPKTLTMYEFHSPWSPNTVKWNNTDPNNYGSPISSATVTSGWTSFDIFNIIQRYKSSTDDMSDFEGVIIKADTETSGTWKKFVSSYGISELRPYISMTYNDNQAVCPQVVSGATYYLKNYNNKYLDVYNANTTDNTRLCTYSFHGDANQQFKITHISGGEYEISPQHTTEKVLSVNSSGQVIIEEDCNRSRQRWYIYYRNGSYHIVNKQYNTGVMAPTYDTDYVSINNEYDCCCWEIKSIDPFDPSNIEYVRYTRITGKNYWGLGSSTDHTISILKSTRYSYEYYIAHDNINGGYSREYAITPDLKNTLNDLEAAYQDHYNIIPAFNSTTNEEKAAHSAKLETDQLVDDGYFVNNSSEYYGTWAYNYTSTLNLGNYWRGVIDTATAVYSVYLNITRYYYSYLMSTSKTTVSLVSTDYKSQASYLDDINNKMANTNYSGKEVLSAEQRNIILNSQGYTNPYKSGTPVVKFTQTSSAQYVRVYTKDITQRSGKWIMKYDDIQGLSAYQIQDKFALPYTPTHYCHVNVPGGTNLYVGIVGENYGSIGGEAVQFELDDMIPDASFGTGNLIQ